MKSLISQIISLFPPLGEVSWGLSGEVGRGLLIFIGGGLGSVLRYLISQLVPSQGGFPLGTFICNILGCFMIGLFNGLAAKMGLSNELRLMLTVGLCGGFTTFSTFSNEGLAMIHSEQYGLYSLYTILSIILGLIAILLGNYVINN